MRLVRLLAFASALFSLALWVTPGFTQARPAQEFTVLSPPQATEPGKVEVIEFFSYACGHCYRLEPFLEAWEKKLPPDVVFRRVPGVGSEQWSALAQLFYTLEAMNQLTRLHPKIFAAMHEQNQNLTSAKVRDTWLAANGVDAQQYAAVEKSLAVQSKLGRARQLMSAYKVDGVPMLVVNGKYVTSSGAAGGPERVVPLLERLIAMARAEGSGAKR